MGRTDGHVATKRDLAFLRNSQLNWSPGYMPLWPGVAGPVLWILGWIFTTVAHFQELTTHLTGLTITVGYGLAE
jgi:hypothetical protein